MKNMQELHFLLELSGTSVIKAVSSGTYSVLFTSLVRWIRATSLTRLGIDSFYSDY